MLLNARSRQETIPARQPFSAFPSSLGNWQGTDAQIPPDSLAVLGAGDFLLRDYLNPETSGGRVDLFLAYFPTQKAGDTIHSPKHCLPGSGWTPVQSSEVSLSLPGQRSFPVNRYLVVKGGQRALVLYWYRAHNRDVANEYVAKYYLIADSIRVHRSDGSLIRVSTLIEPGENDRSAQARLIAFLTLASPEFKDFIPS
jgi:EpsI family protein